MSLDMVCYHLKPVPKNPDSKSDTHSSIKDVLWEKALGVILYI
jgi:hypothetical protein